MNNYFIVLDIETTGFSPDSCEITEIGALKVDKNTLEVIDTFHALIDINGPVPYNITRLTGITKRMLDREGQDLSIVLDNLSDFCGKADIYAHYAPFDKRFIRYYLNKNNIQYIETNWVDTISIFKKAFPKRRSYKLESLIIDHRLASSEDHRAISDARHTLTLLRKCKDKIK